MLSLNSDVIGYMVNNVQPELYTLTEVKKTACLIGNFRLVSVEWNRGCYRRSEEIKEMFDLIKKYSIYNKYYETPEEEDMERPNFDRLANPQLLDALAMGVRGAGSSVQIYTPQVEEDIKRIIELMPRSLNCNLGQVVARRFVFPLAMACLNSQIPLHIIELFIKKGADLKATYHLSGKEVTILYDLSISKCNLSRYKDIKLLFNKYSNNG